MNALRSPHRRCTSTRGVGPYAVDVDPRARATATAASLAVVVRLVVEVAAVPVEAEPLQRFERDVARSEAFDQQRFVHRAHDLVGGNDARDLTRRGFEWVQRRLWWGGECCRVLRMGFWLLRLWFAVLARLRFAFLHVEEGG